MPNGRRREPLGKVLGRTFRAHLRAIGAGRAPGIFGMIQRAGRRAIPVRRISFPRASSGSTGLGRASIGGATRSRRARTSRRS